MRPLIILRPEPGASASAKAARTLGLDPILIPLFRIDAVIWSAPDPTDFDGLLITSANALRAAGPDLRKLAKLPVYAVGDATRKAAEQAGLIVQAFGSGGIDALLATLQPNLKLLHLCGIHRRPPHQARQEISTLPVYLSSELPIPEQFDRIEGSVVMVHSPRAASRLAQLFDETGLARSQTAITAISSAAAAATGNGWERVEVADAPNDGALLALAARLCQNGSR